MNGPNKDKVFPLDNQWNSEAFGWARQITGEIWIITSAFYLYLSACRS